MRKWAYFVLPPLLVRLAPPVREFDVGRTLCTYETDEAPRPKRPRDRGQTAKLDRRVAAEKQMPSSTDNVLQQALLNVGQEWRSHGHRGVTYQKAALLICAPLATILTMAAKKAPSPAMEFLVSALKANRKASYADLKAKADEKKLKLFPIMFGRAQALLGIVKSAKRGTGKFAKASAAKRGATPKPSTGTGRRGRQPDANSKSGQIRELLKTDMSVSDIAKKLRCTPALVYNVKARAGGGGAKRGPGRPPKAKAAAAGLDGIAGIVAAVQSSERERAQLRAALERVQGILVDALG